MAREQRSSEPEPVYFRIGGIVTVAAGIGIGVLSFIVDRFSPKVRIWRLVAPPRHKRMACSHACGKGGSY
jgi:hypothetical protein